MAVLHCCLLFLSLLLLPLPAESSSLSPPDARPTDIGDYWEQEIAHGIMPVRNQGTSTLRIERAEGGCACTMIQDWSRDLAPGETGFVSFTFSTQGMVGEVTKTVHLFTDENPGENEWIGSFTARVRPWEMHAPEVLEMGRHTAADHVLRAYRLYRMHESWEVTGVTMPDPRLHVWFRRKNSRFWKIYFTVRPDAAPGKFFEVLTVHTNSATMPTLPLLVSGEIAAATQP